MPPASIWARQLFPTSPTVSSRLAPIYAFLRAASGVQNYWTSAPAFPDLCQSAAESCSETPLFLRPLRLASTRHAQRKATARNGNSRLARQLSAPEPFSASDSQVGSLDHATRLDPESRNRVQTVVASPLGATSRTAPPLTRKCSFSPDNTLRREFLNLPTFLLRNLSPSES